MGLQCQLGACVCCLCKGAKRKLIISEDENRWWKCMNVGLNIFDSDEKDWAWYKMQQSPHMNVSSAKEKQKKKIDIEVHLQLWEVCVYDNVWSQ